MSVFPAIMCGGSGTRLWPMSRTDEPKQFVNLLDGASTFQETVRRVSGVTAAVSPLIVAGVAHESAILRQLSEIGTSAELLLEPEARDSAAAMAAAAAWILDRDPEGVAVILAADHFVPDSAAFCAAVDQAVLAAREGWIVTLGVKPTHASSAYGYIASTGEPAVQGVLVERVSAFVEKPTSDVAADYIQSGYVWNSGNFVVQAKVLLQELEAHAPEVAAAARRGLSGGELLRPGSLVLGDDFRTAPKISVDHAVMESTTRAAVLPVSFSWTDLGAWDAVLSASQTDDDGNSARGEAALIGARRTLVRATHGMFVAAIGVSDIAIVAEHDAVLVCALSDSQYVKQVAAQARLGPKPGSAAQAAPGDVGSFARWYGDWLFTQALPLWWTLGADHERGGFHESLDLAARPTGAARRARCQTRQAYVYATAGRLGWTGPWRQAARHGLEYFTARYRMPSGLFRTQVGPDGEPTDDTAMLYDHAFALLAMAALQRADPIDGRLSQEAETLAELIEHEFAHVGGGFCEAGERRFQSNPHMHLFEAALAWIEAGGGERWHALAARIANLALDRFIDPKGGFLREYFDAAWAPTPGHDGRIVEPGHQFEWAWLLHRWGELSGDKRASQAAAGLVAHGERGLDPSRDAVVAQLDDTFGVIDSVARLWPQTERIKATLRLGDADSDRARSACRGLSNYLAVKTGGLWRDRRQANGDFVTEPAPASSFYHLVAAHEELARLGESQPPRKDRASQTRGTPITLVSRMAHGQPHGPS